jgi:hypothetical protein
VVGGQRWRSHAFGLALDSAFPLDGCSESKALQDRPYVRLDLARYDSVQSALATADRTVLAERNDPARRWTVRVEARPTDGYLMTHSALGLFHVSCDAARICCSPYAVESWHWQRYLVGQVLPFVSALRGLEPLHASAVGLRGTALAMVGASGRGKSSLAAELALAGAALFADDVVALEPVGEGVVAYPGTELLSLRWPTVESIGRARVESLGRCIGSDAEAIRLAVKRADMPLPLTTLYQLAAAPGTSSVRLSPILSPDLRLLLGASFISSVRTPARLTRQLDVCARIAKLVRIVRLEIPPRPDYGQIALEVLADAERATVATDACQ